MEKQETRWYEGDFSGWKGTSYFTTITVDNKKYNAQFNQIGVIMSDEFGNQIDFMSPDGAWFSEVNSCGRITRFDYNFDPSDKK